MQEVTCKQAVNGAFFIIVICIIFLDALLLGRWDAAEKVIKDKDRDILLNHLNDTLRDAAGLTGTTSPSKDFALSLNHITKNNNATGGTFKSWEAIFERTIFKESACICIQMKLTVAYVLFLTHLVVLGISLMIYVILCGLEFHQSMFIVNGISMGCLVGSVVVTLLAVDNKLLAGSFDSPNPSNLRQFVALYWVIFGLNAITIGIQTVQCILGHSRRESDTYLGARVRQSIRRLRTTYGAQDDSPAIASDNTGRGNRNPRPATRGTRLSAELLSPANRDYTDAPRRPSKDKTPPYTAVQLGPPQARDSVGTVELNKRRSSSGAVSHRGITKTTPVNFI